MAPSDDPPRRGKFVTRRLNRRRWPLLSAPEPLCSAGRGRRCGGGRSDSPQLVIYPLLGLGFPYFLSALMEGHPVMMCVDDVSVYLVCLVVVLVIVVGTFTVFKFQLRPIMGIILIVVYILFFLMAVLRDQDVLDLGVACDAGH